MFAEDDETEKAELSDGALDELLEETEDDEEDELTPGIEGEEEGREWA